jgi:ribosome-associated protein
VRVWHAEGYHGLRWVLLDYVDFVVHVFQKEAREFYGLEKLWGDARITRVEDN